MPTTFRTLGYGGISTAVWLCLVVREVETRVKDLTCFCARSPMVGKEGVAPPTAC